MAKVELKAPIVQEIADSVKDAQAVVLVSSRGLTVAQDTEMRRELREAGVNFKVYKNTMMRRAFEGTVFADLDEYLVGPSAIAISKDDVTAPARILNKYAKAIEPMELKAGVIEGKLCGVDELKELASIPSREALVSRLLGSMQSPIANFARVIKQIAENGGAETTEDAPAEETAEAEAPVAEAEAPAEEAAETAAVEETNEEASAEAAAEESKEE